MIGLITRSHDTFSTKPDPKKLADGVQVRGEIPTALDPFLQGTTPAVEIPESSVLYQAGSIFCIKANLVFAEGKTGIPAYLYYNTLAEHDQIRITLSQPKDTFAQDWADAWTLRDWRAEMAALYAAGVPNFEEIERRLFDATGDDTRKLQYGMTLRSYQGKLIMVARACCRDVYYEAASIDGVMQYRTEYIGPKPSKTFDLTADQLWEELVRNTLHDIWFLFKCPRHL